MRTKRNLEVGGDLLRVAVANALCVRIQVVVDPEPERPVADVDGHARAVLRERCHRRDQDHRVAGDQRQARQRLGERGRALRLRDAVELGRDGLHAEGLQALDVHPRRIEVADLLRRRALCGRAARPCGLLQQVPQLRLDRVLHHEVAGDLQLVGRDLRRIEPAAARVAPEVLTRVDRQVHLGRRESEREAEVGRGACCRVSGRARDALPGRPTHGPPRLQPRRLPRGDDTGERRRQAGDQAHQRNRRARQRLEPHPGPLRHGDAFAHHPDREPAQEGVAVDLPEAHVGQGGKHVVQVHDELRPARTSNVGGDRRRHDLVEHAPDPVDDGIVLAVRPPDQEALRLHEHDVARDEVFRMQRDHPAH
jgi:hypothetical protein